MATAQELKARKDAEILAEAEAIQNSGSRKRSALRAARKLADDAQKAADKVSAKPEDKSTDPAPGAPLNARDASTRAATANRRPGNQANTSNPLMSNGGRARPMNLPQNR